ncbi:radical SAM protein, partial [bacterium]|nr:radical SAM protein [bacterium]
MNELRFIRDRGSFGEEQLQPPIYISPEAPYWFVPNRAGARLLESGDAEIEVSARGKDDLIRSWNAATGTNFLKASLEVEHFFRALDLPAPSAYNGRADMKLSGLSELWLHLTDACNLRCQHCLFGDNFSKKRELALATVKKVVNEAVALGCSLICFTGGEPFLYPGFIELLGWVQEREELQVAILTNGTLIEKQLNELKKLDRERLHLQVSLEGPQVQNDAIRGEGTFALAVQAISRLREHGFSVSVATTVETRNMRSLPELFAIL